MMTECEYEENSTDKSVLISPSEKYSKSRRYGCVLVLWFYSLIAYCDRYSLSGILSELKIVFDIGNTGVAVLQTVFVISYMAIAPIIGYYGDRYERKHMLIGALVLELISNVAGSFVREKFWILLATRALLGVSECVLNILAYPFLSDLFPPNVRVYAIQFLVTAIPIGSGLGYIVGSWSSQYFGGWWYVLRVTIPFSSLLVVAMAIVLPNNLERGAMEPEIPKTASGYKDDVKHILKIRTFVSACVGCICSQIVTGAATVFFPDFVSTAGVLQNVVVPCAAPPCEYTHIVFRFGAIAIFAGFAGAIISIVLAKVGRDIYKNELIEAELCAAGCLIAACSVYMITAFASNSLTIAWIFSAVSLIGLSMNWGLSIELVIGVIPPSRRSTAKAFFHLISHGLGDAPAPLLVGGLADIIHKYEYDGNDTYLFDYKSLQKSIQIIAVPTCLLGGLAFFDAALHVLSDKAEMIKKKTPKSTSYYENESFGLNIPLEQMFPSTVPRTITVPDLGCIEQSSSNATNDTRPA